MGNIIVDDSAWEPFTNMIINIAECVYDLTTVACSVLFKDVKYNIDSRDLFQHIFEWALEFEKKDYDKDNYMLAIELFAYEKLESYIAGY